MVTFFLIMRFFVISYRPSSAVRDMVNILIIFRKCIWFSYRIPLNHIPLNSYENRKFLQKYFCPNSVYWGLKGNIRNEFCYCSNFLFYVKFWINLHVKYKNDWLICFIYLNIFRIGYQNRNNVYTNNEYALIQTAKKIRDILFACQDGAENVMGTRYCCIFATVFFLLL